MTEKKKSRDKEPGWMTVWKYRISGIQKFFIGLLVGCILGSSAVYFNMKQKPMIDGFVDDPEDADVVLDDGVITHTTAEFEEAILGYARTRNDLIVMEQPVSVVTTITRAGLANLAIFSKVKEVTFHGTGIYTISFSKITSSSIMVDHEQKLITITIPHAELKYMNFDVDRTEFEDTEKGLLAFGELKLTAEEQNELEVNAKKVMEERLNSAKCYEDADRIAQLKLYQIYQNIIISISPSYSVSIAVK